MTYLSSDRNKRRRTGKLFTVIIAFILVSLLFSLIFWGISGGIKKLSFKGQEIFDSIPFFAFFKNKVSLESENRRLKEENINLISLSADRDLLAKNLEELDEFPKDKKGVLTARVLGKPGSTPYDVLFVDKGSFDGLIVGSQVFSGEISIGRVSEVLDDYSKVELFTSPKKILQASLLNSGVSIEIVGIGGGVYESNVPVAEPGQIGELVVSQNRRKVIGKIERVIQNDSDTLKRLIIRPLVNPFEIKWVTIEKK